MVWESHYWKLKIKELIVEISVLSEQPDASDLDISKLEIAIFTGWFLVRKLCEAQTKLSANAVAQTVTCEASRKANLAPKVDLLNGFHIDELYDFEGFEQKSLDLKTACNLFIHSIFLWMVFDADGLPEGEATVAGVYLTSDFDKDKLVYKFGISEIVRVFQSIVDDENDISAINRDPNTGDWIVKRA